MKNLRLYWLVISALLVAAPAFAQRDLGTITGTVLDSTGSVVPGAKVNITSEATGVTSTTETGSTGVYVRPALPPGTYTVEVEAAGFKKALQKGIPVTAGDRVQVNMTLEVGQVTESIEVSAAPVLLQSESTIVGQNLNSRNVSELPLGGQRKFTFLARLSPAVYPAEPGARDAAGGGFSANGVRSNGQNNFLLNGVDNNVNVIDFINQTAYVIGPSVEAIGEMKIMTNGYNAEYGRGAGGVVNVTIKSGSNNFHGRVFEHLQNDRLDANKWENNRAGVRRGAFKQNQFGVAVGGPLVRDKLFWFADYQGTRIRSTGGAVPGLGNTFTRSIPFPEMVNGNFSRLLTGRAVGTDAAGRAVMEGAIYDPNTSSRINGQLVRDPFPGNIIPANRMDRAAARLAALFPAPNQNLGERLANNNFIVVTSGRQQNDQGDLRLDYHVTEKDILFGSLSWSEESKFQTPPLSGLLDSGGFAGETEENKSRNAMLSYTRVWSPTTLTETRLAFSRLITQRVQANSSVDAFREAGIGGLNPFTATDANGGLPLIDAEGYAGFGGGEWLPTLEYSNVWDFIQNVSITKGSHALKFGFEYRPIEFPFFQVPSPRGTFRFRRAITAAGTQFDGPTGDGFAAFLLGIPARDTRITTTNFISSQKSAYAWFAQDDWKLTPRLTLNLGVRYELFSPIAEKFGRQSNFEYMRAQPTLVIPEGRNQDAPLPPNFPTQIAVERGKVDKYLIPWDKTDISPRIGIAWQVLPQTVIRAGYGIFYGGEENQGGNPNRGESVPFNQETRLEPPTNFDFNPFIRTFSDGFPANVFSLPAPISYRTVAPNWRNPLVHKWNFAIQRELGWNTVWEVDYIGSKGQRLVLNWDPNAPINDPRPGVPSAPRRPLTFSDTGISETAAFGRSNYNALATKVEKRFSHGLDFLASYTWGHALTDVGTTLSGGPVRKDPRNIAASYANAAHDIRHRFVSSFLYELPIGRGRQFGADMSRALDALVGGWQVNGILSLQSGNWRNITSRRNACSCGSITPDVVAGRDPNDAPSGGRTPGRWFDTEAVIDPALGTFGTLGPMAVTAPGLKSLDASIFKRFALSERWGLTFRAEFFNFTNTPQFNPEQMNTTQGDGAFGRINGTLPGTERHVQFALRLEF
ncbi:MAG: TonB-dependent receptor [Acidobacteria bacterium]|nr:TonB-dependent receptor [Acidobacteriota bacterium]